MTNPILKRAKGHGVAINIAAWEGKAGPILCIHGITANCRCWDVLAHSLSPAYRVLAMDLRGRGRSEKPATGYSLEYHVQDIRCVLDDLRIDRAVIMGHSLGAFIGLAFAAEHPERVEKLILVDGGGDLSKEQMDKVFAGIKPSLDRLGQVYPDTEAYLSKMRQAPFIQPWSPAIENYYRYEIEETDDGVRTNITPAHIAEEADNIRKVKCSEYYARVRCNVLILRATDGLLSDDDLLLPGSVVDRMLREIPKPRWVNVPGANHYGMIFQPHPARDQAIRKFLRETGSVTAL
jgi:pimeloyl-ACP methyl ester carboxylesterase